MPSHRRAAPPLPPVVFRAFAFGLAVSLLMVWRSQVDGDVLNLLKNGWAFVAEGKLLPYGNPLSAGVGGREPGPLTSILVGLPLALWQDFRAPALLILLFHVLAFFLLDRVLANSVTQRERVLYLLIYWLSPWRLFFSGFLWNPNWLFLAGAVHLWSAFRLRERSAFLPSAAHVLAVGCAFQLHPSALILGLASALLTLRRRMRVHWIGAAVGVALVAAMLIPWFQAVSDDPSLLPKHSESVGRSIPKSAYQAARGVYYWIGLTSLSFPTRITKLDFGPTLGDAADVVLRPVFWFLTEIVAGLTLLPAAALFLSSFRKRRRKVLAMAPAVRSPRSWLKSYAWIVFAAACIAFVTSPTTVMAWQVLIVFHAAALLAVLRIAELRGPQWGPRARRYVAVLLAGFVLFDAVALVAAPVYRRGGYGQLVAFHPADDPMIAGLGIDARCVVIDSRTAHMPPTDHRPTWRGGRR